MHPFFLERYNEAVRATYGKHIDKTDWYLVAVPMAMEILGLSLKPFQISVRRCKRFRMVFRKRNNKYVKRRLSKCKIRNATARRKLVKDQRCLERKKIQMLKHVEDPLELKDFWAKFIQR